MSWKYISLAGDVTEFESEIPSICKIQPKGFGFLCYDIKAAKYKEQIAGNTFILKEGVVTNHIGLARVLELQSKDSYIKGRRDQMNISRTSID